MNSGKIEAYFASDESEEKLKQLLEFCKKLPESCYEMFPTYTSDLEAIKSGNFLFIEADGKGLFNKSLFQFLRKGYGKNNYVLTGYPSVEGSGIYLYVDREWPKLGISASCENKEAAWKFIRSLLTEEAQEDASYLPIRKEAFEKMLESREDYVMENGKKRYLTKKERALVYRLVDSAGYIMISGTSNEGELTTIVAEEAESYFSGDKDLDETMKVIKSRINLYKNERE